MVNDSQSWCISALQLKRVFHILSAGVFDRPVFGSRRSLNSSVSYHRTKRPFAHRAGQPVRWPNFSDYRPQLAAFYRPSGYQPAWLPDAEPTPQAIELIKILQAAAQYKRQAMHLFYRLAGLVRCRPLRLSR
jgi:hypothetical protein